MSEVPANTALVIAFVPVARKIARRTAQQLGCTGEADDLEGAALEGLVDAGRRFDARRGLTFATFARYRVHGAIIDSLRARDGVPRSARNKARIVEQAKRRFYARHGRSPTESELAAQLEMTPRETREFVRRADRRPLLSLSASADVGLPEEATDTVDPLAALLRRRACEALERALGDLPERERFAIRTFYLDGRPMKAIGAELGVTESRVSQLCSQGLSRLRTALRSHVE